MNGITFSISSPSPEEFLDLFLTTSWNDDYQLSLSEIGNMLEDSWRIVVAHQGQHLIGVGRIVSDNVHAMIYDLIVHPDYQKNGIGSKILALLIDLCESNHIRDIQLFCARGKRSFYEQRGFVARDPTAPGMEYKKSQIKTRKE